MIVMPLFGLIMLGAVLAAPASAVSADGVRQRDALIASQEALLNVYRCRFGIDTGLVPGGCFWGVPVRPAVSPPLFSGHTGATEVADRDVLIASQEALLNVYRCRFGVDTGLVPGGCDLEGPAGLPPAGDPPVEVGWQVYEEDGRHQPNLGRLWREGAYISAISSERAPAGAVPELRVACFESDAREEPLLRTYVVWDWFVTSRIDTYELELVLAGGEIATFEAINSTSNEASFLRYEDAIAEFANLLVDLDGQEITVSSFIPFGGYRISATFDLTGSSSAISPVLRNCPSRI